MLRGLTERPNVLSTLILSRRDGSIIRATGVGTSEEKGSSASGKSYQWAQVQESNVGSKEASASDRPDDPAGVQQAAKPFEALAASIFHFVNNANVLGAILGTASQDGVRGDGTSTAGYGQAADASKKEKSFDEDAETSSSADEVQLLRLRIKHQEIIIFPDANYICCVVQRIGKANASHERR
jgi:hypothetical protein